MKKFTLCLMLIFAILIVPVAIFAAEGDVAKIGDTGYATLADAVAAVPADKTETTIELLKNVEDGPGIVVNDKQNIVIDFNGFSYDASKPTVGSAGTETISLQILKGSTVTLKNGTLTSKTAKRIIQDYSDLTLEDMIIDGTKSSNQIGYVISFINGNVNIIGNTSIIATEGNAAFDNYFWPEYGYTDGAKVTIDTTGTIKGDIEFSSSTKGLETTLPSTLTIKNVKHDGLFNFVDERFKNSFVVEGGTYVDLGFVVAGVNRNNKEVTIKLLKTVEDGAGIVTVNGQNVVIDFNGFSYDASNPTVGSDGTKTLSCQLNKGSTVTFKNGTFTTVKAKRLIQNYAKLTLDNMVIDGTKAPISGYVASFNNGKVEVKGNTTILAKEGDCAFDVCWWPKGYQNGAQVVINTTGKIDGDIEIGDYLEVTEAQKADIKATLEIKNAYLDGEIKVAKEYLAAGIGKNFKVTGGIYTNDVKDYLTDGLICPKINNEYHVVSDAEHKITVNNVEGGKVVVNKDKAQYGDIIEFIVTTDKGYKLVSLEQIVNGEAKADLASNNSFTMLFEEDVVLKPIFVKLTQDVQVPTEVANEKEVEAMILESLKELIASDKDLAAEIEGKNVEVEVQVKSVEADKIDKKEKEQIEKEAAKEVEDIKVAQYIDITILVKDSDTDEKIDELENVKKAITFTVAKPKLPDVAEGYTRIFYVIRNHNGDIDVWEAKEVDGKLSFESDKFSTYAIAYKDVEITEEVKPEEDTKKPTTPEVPKTGDNLILYVALAGISIFGIAKAKKANTSKRKH